MRPDPLLDVRDLRAGYGPVDVVKGISFHALAGEIVAIIGANGAGKTTTFKTVCGLVRPTAGSIRFGGREVAGLPVHRVVRSGIALVPEGRMVFPDQTVLDNLRLGAYGRRGNGIAADLERQFLRFPILRERQGQLAGTLSGGEQQMLAIARGLMGCPRLLLLDEPSLGLAPRLVRELCAILPTLRDGGLTIVLVEQMAALALEFSDRAYVLEQGRIALEGTGRQLLDSPEVARAYLGRRRQEGTDP